MKENTFGRRHPPRRPKHSKTPKPHELNKSRSKRNSGSSLQDEGGKITPPSHFHTPWLVTVCVSPLHSSSLWRFCFWFSLSLCLSISVFCSLLSFSVLLPLSLIPLPLSFLFLSSLSLSHS